MIKSGEDEICGACSRHSTGRTMCKILVGTAEGNNLLEDINVALRILLKWVPRKCFGKVFCGFVLFRIRTQWLAFVRTVMKLWVP
jgi:hypothetical protein